MFNKQSLGYLSITWAFVTLIFATGLISTSRAGTNVIPPSNKIRDTDGTPVGAAYIQTMIQVTPAYIVNLPIVIKDPAPTNIPIPTPTGEVTPEPLSCNPSNGSGGLSPGNYVTTVAGVNASVVVSDKYDPQKPTYLSFHLHGDNGNWKPFGEQAAHTVTKFVNEQGWILVVPESPTNDGASWWDWNEEDGDHRQALADVLAEMFSSYNLCRNIIMGAAGSGGSEFWTRQFFPRYGQDYPAHMLIACGGNDAHGGDRQRVMDLGADSEIVARTTLYFLYGTEDGLVPLIEKSIDMYQDAEFKVIVEKLEGAGHCNEWKDAGLLRLREQTVLKWGLFAETLGLE